MRNSSFARLATPVLTMVVMAFCLAPASATSANLSHSYSSTTPIDNGSLVSADPNKASYVIPANISNGSKLIGVAVQSDDSLLAVDPGGNKVQVATSGSANTLVSSINGDIKIGDQIAVSPFSGIGMKADPGNHIIGLAQSALNSSSEGVVKRTVTDRTGKQQEISVGYVKIAIAVGTDTADATGVKLNSLQKLGKSLTGHVISTIRIVISIGVAIIAIVSLVTLIYASIYGSIISIGRNPLARFSILRTLGQVMAMAGLTALIAGTTIFLLLR